MREREEKAEPERVTDKERKPLSSEPCWRFSGCVSQLRKCVAKEANLLSICYHVPWAIVVLPIPSGSPAPFSAAVSSESKRNGCPINLTNLCRMRAKCQQTKSQVASRQTPPQLDSFADSACSSSSSSISSNSLAAFQQTHVVCISNSSLEMENSKMQNTKHTKRECECECEYEGEGEGEVASKCRFMCHTKLLSLPSCVVVVVVVTVTSFDLFNCRFLSHFN